MLDSGHSELESKSLISTGSQVCIIQVPRYLHAFQEGSISVSQILGGKSSFKKEVSNFASRSRRCGYKEEILKVEIL